MKKRVYVMSGISGSGKSTWVNNYLNLSQNANKKILVLSSDQVREELNLSADDTTVFAILDAKYREALVSKEVDEIIIDTTALSARRRSKFLRKNDAHVIVVLVLTPFINALRNLKRRQANIALPRHKRVVVPYEVLKLQLKALTIPIIGYDCDEFIVTGDSFFNNELHSFAKGVDLKLALSTITKLDNFLDLIDEDFIDFELNGLSAPHNSSFHLETIDTHIDLTIKGADTVDLKVIALLHDLGKGLFRTDGETYSSYRGHEKLGALIYLNALFTRSRQKELRFTENNLIAMVSYLHMIPFQGFTPKTIKRYKLNEELINYLYRFNKIDKGASITQ